MSRYFDAVMIPIDIFDEVEQLTESKVKRLGLKIFEPDDDTYRAAASMKNGCSFEDRICLLEARKNDWSIVTSDKALNIWCTREGIVTYWGLQVMIVLVEAGLMKRSDALVTAGKIRENNAMITEAILNDFIQKLNRK